MLTEVAAESAVAPNARRRPRGLTDIHVVIEFRRKTEECHAPNVAASIEPQSVAVAKELIVAGNHPSQLLSWVSGVIETTTTDNAVEARNERERLAIGSDLVIDPCGRMDLISVIATSARDS